MRVISILSNPAMLAVIALFLSVVWMLRDEKDKARVELVFALALNLFYGVFFTFFMTREGAVFPNKYDHVLVWMDVSLGIRATTIARALQAVPHNPLWMFYDAMIPMMIAWYFVARRARRRGSIILAYTAELVSGPLLYMIVPACGPIYAFGKQWLDAPTFPPAVVHGTGMPNAFPSLHLGTAFVFLMFAPNKLWKCVALLFFAATCLATLSTGEHYVIDLIPGMVFGVFTSSVGLRNFRRAAGFLGLALSWSLGVRFGYMILIAHPILTRSFAIMTVVAVAVALILQWSATPAAEAEDGAAA